MENLIQANIIIAGWLHLALAIGSLLIPVVLKWKEHLEKVSNLIRQMFWVYAVYIWIFNVFFGLISITINKALINHSSPAIAICILIVVYWLGRIIVQFFYFNRKYFPKGMFYAAGEVVLNIMFLYFTFVYLVAFLWNINYLK